MSAGGWRAISIQLHDARRIHAPPRSSRQYICRGLGLAKTPPKRCALKRGLIAVNGQRSARYWAKRAAVQMPGRSALGQRSVHSVIRMNAILRHHAAPLRLYLGSRVKAMRYVVMNICRAALAAWESTKGGTDGLEPG